MLPYSTGNFILGKVFEKKRGFSGTILGHPKHVLHLVLSPIAIAEAINVMCVWVAVPHQYQISKKKILGHFSIRKNTKPGEGGRGGVEGGLANHQTFYLIFSLKPSL